MSISKNDILNQPPRVEGSVLLQPKPLHERNNQIHEWKSKHKVLADRNSTHIVNIYNGASFFRLDQQQRELECHWGRDGLDDLHSTSSFDSTIFNELPKLIITKPNYLSFAIAIGCSMREIERHSRANFTRPMFKPLFGNWIPTQLISSPKGSGSIATARISHASHFSPDAHLQSIPN